MKIRKILCALTAAAMICSAASCGCVAENPADSGDGATATTTTTERTAETTTNADTSVMDTTDEVTDSGIVTERPETDNRVDKTEENEQTDEAAFASSYINITKIGWGLGKEKNDKNQPLDAVNAQEKYKDSLFLTEDSKICLTFDEGYENGFTAEILDILKEKQVKALFFVTYDYCRTSPELVQRMIDEGHTVGNHSYTHPSFPDCSENEMIEEVMVLHDYVAEKFGYEMTYFRFPKGEFSEKSLFTVNSLGYTPVFWSFAYNDWDTAAQPDRTEALQKIKDSTHSGIYLLHAVSETNTAILGEVIDYWKGEGYEIGGGEILSGQA